MRIAIIVNLGIYEFVLYITEAKNEEEEKKNTIQLGSVYMSACPSLYPSDERPFVSPLIFNMLKVLITHCYSTLLDAFVLKYVKSNAPKGVKLLISINKTVYLLQFLDHVGFVSSWGSSNNHSSFF